jgi:hypothetical protein
MVCRFRLLDPSEVEGLGPVGGLSNLPRPLVGESPNQVGLNDQA